MRTQRLGARGPEVSVVGLGTNNFGARCDLAQTRAVIDAALDEGITLIDTADVYSYGTCESYIGEVLRGQRDRVVLATKFGMQMDGGPDVAPGRREYIRWAVEGSLRRLRTDVIDVYQIHQPDTATPIVETLGALSELIAEGKVRYLGSSQLDAAEIRESESVARDANLPGFISAQNRYSFVHREPEDAILPVCASLGIGVIPYYPLASGLLTGKYTRGEPAEGGRLAGRSIPDEDFARVEALAQFAQARGLALLEVAIGGLLAMPAVCSVIAGATKPEQVRANAQAGNWRASPDDVADLVALR